MQNSPETQAILRRMEEVRCDLDEGAQGIVESARDMVDWRHYVRNYPWIFVGAACAIGYAIVPRSRLGLGKVNHTLAEMADHNRMTTNSPSAPTRGVRRAMLMFAGNLLWRNVLSYATGKASQYFAAKSASSPPEDQP